MTETEWAASKRPASMLAFLRYKVSERRLRLFAVACCGLLGPPGPRMPDLGPFLRIAEDYADGATSFDALAKVQRELSDAVRLAERAAERFRRAVHYYALRAAGLACSIGRRKQFLSLASEVTKLAVAARGAQGRGSSGRKSYGAESNARAGRFEAEEQGRQADLVREVFGNPFRPLAALDPALLTREGRLVPRLAQAAYDERTLPAGTLDPSGLAVLADALEDAGADCRALLAHLRGPGPHVRGCWAVDLLLAKT